MFKFLLFSCLFICTVVNITTVAVSIQEFNTLVHFPMWKSLIEQQSFCNILLTGHDLKGKLQSFNLQTLYSNDESYGTIITEDNFVDRVWQFHLLLSVYYAIELHPLLEHSLANWNFCQEPVPKSTMPHCTESFFDKFKFLTVEIHKMYESLLYFSYMANSLFNLNVKLSNQIHDVLIRLKQILRNGSFADFNMPDQLTIALLEVDIFLACHVEPLTSEVKKGGTQVISLFIDAVFHSRGRIKDETSPIDKRFHNTISNLLRSNFNFGFLFDYKTLSISISLPPDNTWLPFLDKLSL